VWLNAVVSFQGFLLGGMRVRKIAQSPHNRDQIETIKSYIGGPDGWFDLLNWK
jgi:hypothetical protein